jgi:hypothetical protein
VAGLAAAAVSCAACVNIPFDSPADGGGGEGSCTIEPARVQASQEARFSVTCAVGAAGILQGGGFRIQFPVDPVHRYDGFTPPHTGEDYLLGKVTCTARRGGRKIGEARVESNGQGEVRCLLPSGRLRQGDELLMEYSGMAPRAASTYSLRVESRLSGGRGGRPLPRPPALTVIARPARTLHAVLPGTAMPGEPFTLALAALDEFGNLDRAYTGDVEIAIDHLHLEHAFRLEDEGIALISGLKLERPGFARAEVAEKGGAPELALKSRSNPIRIAPSSQEGKVLWGDLHFQTCTGAAAGRAFLDEGSCAGQEEAYTYARDVVYLDFAAATEHAVAPFTDRVWESSLRAAARFNEPPRFTTLAGYQWRDLVVILPGDSGTLLRSDSRLTDERTEMEAALAGGAVLIAVGGKESAIAGSGNHWGHPGCVDHTGLEAGCAGLIAVRAPDNSREAIHAALRSGSTWATTGARIFLSIVRQAGGLHVAVAGTDTLEAVDLVIEQQGGSRTVPLLLTPAETLETTVPMPHFRGRASCFLRAVQRDRQRAWSGAFELKEGP